MARVLSGLVGLGLAAGFAGGQPPAEKPKPAEKRELGVELKFPGKGSLEEAIAAALKNNPDVRVAEAEVQVAQAKLAQARLAVAQKVAAAHAAVERAKAEVKAAEANFARVEQTVKKGFSPPGAADEARQKLEAAKGAVAAAEAEYNALLGVMPGQPVALAVTFAPDGGLVLLGGADRGLKVTAGELLLSGAKSARGSVADKLREGLDKPVTIKSDEGKGLQLFLDWLSKEAGLDITFRTTLTKNTGVSVSIQPGTLSVGALLQLIEDENTSLGLKFYIREYGVLATDSNTPPSGAVSVSEFWKQVKAEKAKEKEKDKIEPRK